MALFTAIGVAAFLGIEAGFIATATAFALNLAVGAAASIGLSYASRALAGQQNNQQKTLGIESKLEGGGAVPRSFGLGYHVTGGSLVWAHYWGKWETPNSVLTQVIAVSDLPGERLISVFVNGEKITLPDGAADYQNSGSWGEFGYAPPEYNRPHNNEGSPTDHLWIRYYDGTQVVADGLCVNVGTYNVERPYETTRVGKGICYLVISAFIDENLWQGIPQFKFELSGIPLYDPSKDTTVGGSGSQRFDDKTTWGGDGDEFPAVQIYNVLRGIDYEGTWLYGLQNTSSARLPATNWIAQIEKCRDAITGASGPEPTYRSGSLVSVDIQPANSIEGFLTACQGKVSEIGGFYKIHVGTPDAYSFSFTDDEIISTEPQTFQPFYSLAESINGIQGTAPDPAQGWSEISLPAIYRADLEVKDGNRRLMANPSFSAVPYPEQAQRLQKSAIEEAQRSRSHTLTLPPQFWTVEPGDIGQWTSERNGYSTKLFRVEASVDKTNLDSVLVLREVDPTDYDWDRGTDLQPVTPGVIVSPLLPAQGVAGWDAEPYSLSDDLGLTRRPAILISWDTIQPGISGLQFEVRRAGDHVVVSRGTVRKFSAGNQIIHEGILPAQDYEVRGQFIPFTPRDMEWSDLVEVTTPDIRFSEKDLSDAIRYEITALHGAMNDRISEIEQFISTAASTMAGKNWENTLTVKNELSLISDAAFARIASVETVSVAADIALASSITTLTATVDGHTSSIAVTATAVATLNGYVAAQYGVTLTVDGYATGFNLINGGVGISAFTVVADKFQVQLPSYNGSAPVPVFTTGTISGTPSIGISANVIVDGTLIARHIAAGTITAAKIAAGTITSASGVIGALSVNSLSIADNAATVPVAQTLGSAVVGTGAINNVNIFSFNLSVDTTGLSGKTIPIYVSCNGFWTNNTGATQSAAIELLINGNVINTYGVSTTTGSSALIPQTGSAIITGNGGVMSVPIVWRFRAPAVTQVEIGATIFAVATKR